MPADPTAASAPRGRDLDLGAAAIYTVVVVLLWFPDWSTSEDLQLPGTYPPLLSLALLVVGALTTVLRKRHPAVVLTVTGLSSTLAMLFTGELAAMFLQFESVFSAVLYGSTRLARFTSVLGVGLTVLASIFHGAAERQRRASRPMSVADCGMRV